MIKLHTTDLTTGDGQNLRKQLAENFKIIEKESSQLQEQIKLVNQQVSELQKQVRQLQPDNADHEKRIEKIEKLLFGFEKVTVTDPSDDIKASQPAAVEFNDTDGVDDDPITTVTIN
ncbi:hypothetical protein [Limosilactobacillus secaliphilus]|uniref:Uncharacterized protein n=1 Tax=Limosilactobacillus secaliphilus TaxID=396268 RepID=A0A0R2I0Y8_9LACO|nr:hypothetical protein [Limosilactobacillus secaliphilus]KRN58785.1 hypothetical protein IV45_GL000410 [Limosilactobacillus secaliphilus]